MSDNADYDGGFFRNLSGLATDWVTSKRRALEHRGTPNTFTDSGGTINKYSWDGQHISQDELAKVRDIREKGGVIAQLFHAKALIRFGTGVELQAENDDLQDLLNEKLFPDLDLLVQDLGEDAIFYPYALGEIVSKRGNGGFSHVEPIEPWTMLPETDDHGDIIRWQHHVGPGEAVPFDTDDIGHIAINKSCGRDKVGISDVLRSEDEIEQYKNNQRAINNAIEVAGFPHILWKVGREGGTPIADDELRRVRSIVESIKSDSQIVMGRDIDTEQINPSEFKFGDITERDLRVLTSTIGLPFELVGYGSDGLGSGHEADLKMQLLRIQNEADRRRFADQFIREFVNPVIEQYTPYSPDEDVTLRFESFLDDKQDMAKWIAEVGEYMRNDDVVEHLGLPPIEDEELATSYRSPQTIEEAEEGGGGQDLPGLFSDAAETALDGLELSEGMPEWEAAYLSMYEHALWHDDTDRALAGFSESQLPEMVTTRLREAILSGAIFSDFDDIPSSDLMELRQTFVDTLSEDGWTLDEMTNSLQDLEPQLSDSEAETIARTETASAVNTAREEAYEDRDLANRDEFYWSSTADHRRTEACEWLTQETERRNGVTLETLRELIEEAPTHDDDMQNDLARPENYVIHPNERSTYIRRPE